MVSSVAVGKLNETRRGFPTPVGPPIFLAGLQNGALDAAMRSTTDLTAPPNHVSVGQGPALARTTLPRPPKVETGGLGPASFVQVR